MMMWKSFGIEGYEYDTPQKNYLASCIALSKYDEAISVIENKKSKHMQLKPGKRRYSSNFTCVFLFFICRN